MDCSTIYLSARQLTSLFSQVFAGIKEKAPDKVRDLLAAFVESVVVIDPETSDVTLFGSIDWWRRWDSNPRPLECELGKASDMLDDFSITTRLFTIRPEMCIDDLWDRF